MRKILLSFMVALLALVTATLNGQKLPPHSRILYFGDSQTSFGYGTNGNAVQYQNYGYVSWVNALAPGVQTPKGGVLGVPGETTSQMLNRLNAISTFGAKFIVVMAGTNDPLYGIGPETTKSNLRKIYDAGISNGMKVIAICIMPRFEQNAYNATNEANRININNWIKSQTDVVVVDAENELNGPENFEDGLHNSPLGAYKLGNKVAAVINKLVFSCIPGSQSAADLSMAPNSNPLLTGTTGRLNTASGTVATNWELHAGFAGGASVSGSKETDAEGKERQVINIAGSYIGNTSKVTFNNYATSPISLASGNVVEGISEIEITSAMTNIRGMYLKVTASTGDYSTILSDGCSMFPTSNKPLNMPAGKYILRTPAMTIGSGTVGQLTTQLVIELAPNSVLNSVSATIKVSSIGVRRLPLANGPQATITPAGTVTLCPGATQVLTANGGSGYGYQWKLNGTNIASANASTYSASNTGSYTVAVAASGCSVLSDPTTIVAGTCNTNTITTGSVTSKLCSGQPVDVPFTVSNAFNSGNVFTAQLSNASGSFATPVNIGSLSSTGAGVIKATIPSSTAQGTGYRIRVVASNPAATGSDNGVNIAIYSVPVLTSTLTPPAICNNSVFTYTPTATPAGTTFSWSRGAVTGISNAAASGTGSISETLQNTTSAAINVSYVYRLSNNGCSNPNAYTVVVAVNPSPVARTKNITVNLDATKTAVITPQQVDNGSTGYCGTLQYSLDKTQFTCTNLGANTVTLRVTDGAGNSSSSAATVTVTDANGVCTVNTNTITTGSIATKLCAGQPVDVPYTVSNAFGSGNVFTAQLSNASGAFTSPVAIGSLSGTGSGTIKATVPSSTPQGTGYRIRVVASNPAATGSANTANIAIYTTPVLTSTLTPPAICNNSVFNYTPTANVSGTTFSWSRAVVSGISNAAASGSGSISEVLRNTTTAPVKVTYVYRLSNNGCNSIAYNVVVSVNPSPVVRTRNITANLDATGQVTITPQQVDNGTTGYCGTLQYSLSRTQFSCANIGGNTVTLTARDQAGNSSSATAIVTVRDATGPVISRESVSPSVLSNADQRMKAVDIEYYVADNCGGTTTSVLSVRSNEPVSGLFIGDQSPDWEVSNEVFNDVINEKNKRKIRLRAERNPFGSGRVYTITLVTTDARGNRSTREFTVTVPVVSTSTSDVTGNNGNGVGQQTQGGGLSVSVLSNPTGSHFTIATFSKNPEPIQVRVYDVIGRPVESRGSLPAVSNFTIGHNYRPGPYLMEVIQGMNKLQLRLVKTGQ